ncbi:MAG: glycoside hydrolase family 43 protein [Phycisphaerales bacterium JB039]
MWKLLRAAAPIAAVALASCASDPDRTNPRIHKLNRDYGLLLPDKAEAEPGAWFVFAYFTEPEPELRLALSSDGYEFRPLLGGRPVLNAGRLWLRDPCVALGPDGLFHAVWTGGNTSQIGYATSPDLLTWSAPRALDVMQAMPGSQACWAPEIVWDEARAEWMILWSSEVAGRFAETDQMAGANHRVYFTTTQDFRTLAAPQLLLDPGYPVIDATLLYEGGSWLLFFKDERDAPAKKQVRMTSGPTPRGPWGPISAGLTVRRVEAPTAAKVGAAVLVYFDEYRDHKYGAIQSRDLQTWRDVSRLISLPEGARHGTVLRIPDDVAQGLLRADEAARKN